MEERARPTTKFWSPQMIKCLSPHKERKYTFGLSNRVKLLNSTPTLMEVSNNKPRFTKIAGDVIEVSWSPDSKRVATLATDNLIRIFNVPTD